MFWSRHAANSSDWTLERKRMTGSVEGLPQQSYNPLPSTPLTRQLLSNNSFVAVVWLIHPTTLVLTCECGEPQTNDFGVNGWVSNFDSIYGRNFDFINTNDSWNLRVLWKSKALVTIYSLSIFKTLNGSSTLITDVSFWQI